MLIDIVNNNTSAPMALLAELKDHSTETYNHSIRVAQMALELYPFSGLPEEIKGEVVVGALLHDVGKLDIPIEILNKPESLNAAEWKIMMQHPLLGAKRLTNTSEIIQNICLYHHKKKDGSGYPAGPVPPDYVKFVTVLDIYDAMVTKRHYKSVIKDEEVIKELKNDAQNNILEEKFINLISHMHMNDTLIKEN